jgi:hypothetical protein
LKGRHESGREIRKIINNNQHGRADWSAPGNAPFLANETIDSCLRPRIKKIHTTAKITQQQHWGGGAALAAHALKFNMNKMQQSTRIKY